MFQARSRPYSKGLLKNTLEIFFILLCLCFINVVKRLQLLKALTLGASYIDVGDIELERSDLALDVLYQILIRVINLIVSPQLLLPLIEVFGIS
mmetsp:Transcript_18427/g.17544  ORF Transcript_18427/g.17544 Transcript_18427/m.17544 type:complete len:94 (-) Transcript_18427:447-728(-)